MLIFIAGLILIPLTGGIALLYMGQRLPSPMGQRIGMTITAWATVCAVALTLYGEQDVSFQIIWLHGTGAMTFSLGATGLYAALVTTTSAFLTLLMPHLLSRESSRPVYRRANLRAPSTVYPPRPTAPDTDSGEHSVPLRTLPGTLRGARNRGLVYRSRSTVCARQRCRSAFGEVRCLLFQWNTNAIRGDRPRVRRIGGLCIGVGSSLLTGLNWVDRRMIARFQGRVGPPWYQPVADLIKLIAKEDILPTGVNHLTAAALPMVSLAAVLTAGAYIPVANTSIASFEGDLIVVLFLFSIPALAYFLAGWISIGVYSVLGGNRALLQYFSYTVKFPFGPAELPEGYRGRVVIREENCRGCGLCVRDCPAFALELEREGRDAYRLIYHPERCAYCGQCELSCNFDAIYLSNEFVPGEPNRENLSVVLVDREEKESTSL